MIGTELKSKTKGCTCGKEKNDVWILKSMECM